MAEYMVSAIVQLHLEASNEEDAERLGERILRDLALENWNIEDVTEA